MKAVQGGHLPLVLDTVTNEDHHIKQGPGGNYNWPSITRLHLLLLLEFPHKPITAGAMTFSIRY